MTASPLIKALLFAAVLSYGQSPGANYDEAKVPKYTLPDPLVMQNGERVRDAETWFKRRRPEILELFRSQVYGRSPERPAGMTFELTSIDRQALGGKAVRKEVSVNFSGKPDGAKMNLLIYLPVAPKNRVPVFLGLNFTGNATVNRDPGIRLGEVWVRKEKRPASEGLQRLRGQPLAGGEDTGTRIRSGHGVLLRHRAGFRRRDPTRSPAIVLQAGADEPGR